MQFYFLVPLALLAANLFKIKCRCEMLLMSSFLLFVPLFVLHLVKRIPDSSTLILYIPYFWFGSSLYFLGTSAAPYVAIGAALMVAADYLPHAFPTLSATSDPVYWANVLVLVLLLAITAALAFKPLSLRRGLDQLLGNLSYPLYVYHIDVLLLLRILKADNHWWTLVFAVLFCLGVCGLFYFMVDPTLRRFRDRIRGAQL
jgi:peptidoglycan/LPS O-acetylase OafA/YrhL